MRKLQNAWLLVLSPPCLGSNSDMVFHRVADDIRAHLCPWKAVKASAETVKLLLVFLLPSLLLVCNFLFLGLTCLSWLSMFAVVLVFFVVGFLIAYAVSVIVGYKAIPLPSFLVCFYKKKKKNYLPKKKSWLNTV